MMTFDVPGVLNSHSPTPKSGDVWHAKLPDQLELWMVEILQYTPLTVQVRTVSDGLGTFRPVRYEHGIIKFIEKVR